MYVDIRIQIRIPRREEDEDKYRTQPNPTDESPISSIHPKIHQSANQVSLTLCHCDVKVSIIPFLSLSFPPFPFPPSI